MKIKTIFKGAFVSFFLVFALIAGIVFMSSFTGSGKKNVISKADSIKGLKDFYKDYFPIGVAVSPRSLEGVTGEFIKKHFNSLTPENVMKPALIQPQEGKFSWAEADKIVDFAQAN